MPREHRERPLSPLSWGRYQQCLLHSEPLLTGAGASQELEEVTAASRGRSAEAHRARLTRQWETTEGAGKTVLPEGELQPCEARGPGAPGRSPRSSDSGPSSSSTWALGQSSVKEGLLEGERSGGVSKEEVAPERVCVED